MEKEKPYSFAELNDIIGIIFQWGTTQGGFMDRIMTAWQTADDSNKQIIHKVVDTLIRKYGLDEECKAMRLKYPKIAESSDKYLKEHETDFY